MHFMFSFKKTCGGAYIAFAILILTLVSSLSPLKSAAQNIDSIATYLSRHLSDTSSLKNIVVELQQPPLIGSPKADSLVAIIKEQSEKLNYTKGVALSYRYLGLTYLNKGDFKTSTSLFNQSLSLFVELEDSVLIIALYQSLASSYFNMGKQDSAIFFCSKVIKAHQNRSDFKKLASNYNTLGGIFWAKGDLSAAAEAFFKSLDLKIKLSDSIGIANTYNNIGILFDSQKKLPEALEMYYKSLEIYQKKAVKRGISRAYNNIAIVLKNLDRCGEAIEMLLKSLEIDKQLGNIDDQAKTLNNIGQLYLQMNEAVASMKYFNSAKELFQNNKNLNGEAASILNLGRANMMLDSIDQAFSCFNQSLLLAKKIHSVELINESFEHLYKLHKKSGNYTLALYYHELNSDLTDSIRSLENLNKLDELKIKYETELKATEIVLLNKDSHIRALEMGRQKSINRFLVLILGLLLLVICLIVIGWFTIRRDNQNLVLKNSEINQQKEEIEAQRDQLEMFNSTLNHQNEEILAQRDQIEAKNTIISATNRRLTENIEYASRIQKALLPEIEQINRYFSEHFIIYKPKDIVSGDFYWMWPQGNKIYFSIADCTGHGVSGAFMSILAYNYLKDSIITKGLTNPEEIISFISNEVENNLYSNIPRHDIKDGMDIIVCCFNRDDNSMEFSGAHSSFYLVRENTLITFKTERYSIGSHINQTIAFSNQKIQLQKGDKLIFYTDGYMDQLNVYTKKKIGGTAFKTLIQSTEVLTMSEQKNRIVSFFDEWKGNYEQIDDVLVWTIKV